MITKIAAFVIIVFGCRQSFGQDRLITGTVRDSVTHAPLPNASIRVKNSSHGALTDSSGRFRLSINKSVRQVTVTNTGYKAYTFKAGDSLHQEYIIGLTVSYSTLEDVVVTFKSGKYRNKDNPAVALIRQVIEHKAANQVKSYPYATYREYEKLQLSFDSVPRILARPKLLKQFHFMFENLDTTRFPGKRLIPVYISETLSDNYFRRRPEKQKTIILGRKTVDFGEFIDMKGLSDLLRRMYETINIYDNNISLFTTQFVSPISNVAPNFYMYFIRDTVVLDGIQLVKLAFIPRNPEDLLFRGTLYITLDGHYAIKKVDLYVSKHTNLNFVREFKASQDFKRDSSGHYFLISSDLIADFGLSAHGSGVFGERAFSYSRFQMIPTLPDSLFSGPSVVNPLQSAQVTDSVMNNGRTTPLSDAEVRAYSNVDSLRGMKSYQQTLDYLTLLIAGYKQAGPFELGPVATFYTFNPVEGFKPRLGGRSTTRLSTRYYVESYLAYGFKDQKWKYYLGGTYSLSNQSIYKYPFNYLRASYQRDTKIPGQEDNFVQENSFLSSFKRGDNTKWLYNDIAHLDYIREFGDHMSYNLGFRYWQQRPGGSITYVYKQLPGGKDSIEEITTSELSATLRWAPHEKFFEGRAGRSPIANQYPIFTFRYAHGFKGLAGGEYNYDAYHLNVYKRVYLSPFGYSDITFDGGYLAGKLPFPLMTIHNANQSYGYYTSEYNLMNFEEFVSDHYAGINIDHYFNGFFFNKIPLLKSLKLREVIAAKILYGGTRDENNPDKTPDQMKFPTTNQITSTFVLQSQPYFEASAGITNIFKVIRVDVVKRFTYLDHPGISTWGIRTRIKFDF